MDWITSFILFLNEDARPPALSNEHPVTCSVAPATDIPLSSGYGGSGGRRDSGGESVYNIEQITYQFKFNHCWG